MTQRIATCLLILLTTFGYKNATAQSDLDKGWSAFYKNDRREAREYFLKASVNPVSRSEADLLLMFIDETEGRNEEAFKDFQDFFKSSADPYPYLFTYWNSPGLFGYRYKLSQAKLDFVKAIANDPKANGTLKALAHWSLGKYFEVVNNVSKAKDEFDKLGTLDKWELAGEFENISESGFDKGYDPIKNPLETSVFINKSGAKVKWFEMPGNRLDKWIDFNYHFFIDNSIIYAQTFVNSPVDQELQLRVGTSGSLKAWVNDLLVYSESKERNNDFDTYNFRVKLNKGYNRILLQVGSSDIDRSNFMARFTNDDGLPARDLTVTSKYQDYKKETISLNKTYKVAGEEYFESKIKQEPERIVYYLALASVYLKNDKAYEARRVLLEAEKKAPECSYIKIKLIEAYNREGDETDSKIANEWLKEHDGDNLISLNLFYEDELKKENYSEVRSLIEKMEKLYGENEETMLKRANLLASLKERDQMITLIENGYKKYPSSYSFVDYKTAIEQNINKNINGTIELLKKYLKDNYSSKAQVKLSDAYFAKGDVENGLAAYSEQLNHEPYNCSIIYRLASYNYKIRNYSEAEKRYKEAISLAPAVNYFWSGLASCYNDMGKKQNAIEAYEKAIVCKPTDYEAREDLRKLRDQPEIFTYFKQHDVYEMCRNAPSPTAFPEDNCIILLNDVHRVIYGEGASEEKFEMVVKVFNQQGIEKWKEYWVPNNSMEKYLIEKAEVVKKNGSKVKAEIEKEHIVFTTLETGDAVHIIYKIRHYPTAKLAPNFWDSFYFDYWFPYQHSSYSLLVPMDLKFKYKFSKTEKTPVIKKVDGFDLYTWEQENEPAIAYENNMPVLADVANILYISSFPDWKYISNWYFDLATAKSKADFEVKEVLNTLMEGKKDLSEMDKAKIIYDYVVSKVSYSSVSFLQSELIPQKASKVINTKIGDCKDVSTLFVAMCREAGLNSDLVLVSTRDRGYSLNVLPSIEFNHCIARVRVDGTYYYIELTSDFLSFNTFHPGLKNAEALVITSDRENQNVELIHLDAELSNKNKVMRETEVDIDDHELIVKNHNLKSGLSAAEMRSSYRDFGEKEQKQEMQQALSYYFTNSVLTDLKFKNIKSLDDVLDYDIYFKAPDAISDVGGMKLLYIPWGDKADSKIFSFSENRTFPMDLWDKPFGDVETETMSIVIPPTFHLTEIPKPVNYSCSVADYSVHSKSVAGKLIMERSFSYKKDFISSAEMKEFSDFYKKVVLNDAKPIAFK